MAKIDPVQLQNQLDMISKDSDKILISKDSDNMPIIALLLSKIENITKEFESVVSTLDTGSVGPPLSPHFSASGT